jgi:hypothetical protein
MARYEHLAIYKQALDVAVHFEQVVAGFSRYHKYTLGTELRNQSRAVVAAIVKANAARDKRAPLLVLRERLDELLITVRIPAHKTLRAAPPDTGLPIGNLNSQFFANVYLNGLDQFVKHELRCRQYLRYCDDFVLLARSRRTGPASPWWPARWWPRSATGSSWLPPAVRSGTNNIDHGKASMRAMCWRRAGITIPRPATLRASQEPPQERLRLVPSQRSGEPQSSVPAPSASSHR